jgi:flagellin
MITPNFISRRAEIELNKSTNSMSLSFERLSSGLRINSAKDDVAGLSITNRMGAQVNGLNQSIRNANDSISLFQTAEGALGEVESMLQRMRELSVQSANGAINSKDREAIQKEITQLQDEIDHISSTTSFNGTKLLSGEHVEKHFQIGANSGEVNKMTLRKMDTDALGRQARYTSAGGVDTTQSLTGGNSFEISSKSGDGSFVSISDSSDAHDSLSKYSSKGQAARDASGLEGTSAIAKAAAINAVSDFTGVRAIVGETRTDNQDFVNNSLGFPAFGNSGSIQAFELTGSTFMEINGAKFADFSVDEADATGTLVSNINARHEETGVIAHIDGEGELVLVAKDGRDISISYHGDNNGADLEALTGLRSGIDGAFAYGGSISLQSDETFEAKIGDSTINTGLGGVFDDDPLAVDQEYVMGTNRDATVGTIDVTTTAGAIRALDVIDLALEQVSSERAKLGALQNRTESTISNLSQTSENLSAASSRIKDADFAVETAHLSSNQIKQQAATSILSQVSSAGQLVLGLLQ